LEGGSSSIVGREYEIHSVKEIRWSWPPSHYNNDGQYSGYKVRNNTHNFTLLSVTFIFIPPIKMLYHFSLHVQPVNPTIKGK